MSLTLVLAGAMFEAWRFLSIKARDTLADATPPAGGPPTSNGMPNAPIPALDIEHELRDSYLTYAMSVIVSRALPDVRDGLKPVQRLLKWAVEQFVKGPDLDTRQSARMEVWGEVRNAAGSVVQGRFIVPEGYTFTADAAIACVRGVRSGAVAAGAVTPAKAFGGEFVMTLPGARDLSFL